MKLLRKIIFLVVVFAVGVYVGQQQLLDISQPVNQLGNDQADSQAASVLIDFGDGRMLTGEASLTGSASVVSALEQAAAANNVTVTTKDYGGEMGVFIEAIAGVTGDRSQDQWWQFWVNNEYSQIGASSYTLRVGDVVMWKLTKGQFGNPSFGQSATTTDSTSTTTSPTSTQE